MVLTKTNRLALERQFDFRNGGQVISNLIYSLLSRCEDRQQIHQITTGRIQLNVDVLFRNTLFCLYHWPGRSPHRQSTCFRVQLKTRTFSLTPSTPKNFQKRFWIIVTVSLRKFKKMVELVKNYSTFINLASWIMLQK